LGPELDRLEPLVIELVNCAHQLDAVFTKMALQVSQVEHEVKSLTHLIQSDTSHHTPASAAASAAAHAPRAAGRLSDQQANDLKQGLLLALGHLSNMLPAQKLQNLAQMLEHAKAKLVPPR